MRTSNKLLLAALLLVLVVITGSLITLKTQGILVPQTHKEQTPLPSTVTPLTPGPAFALSINYKNLSYEVEKQDEYETQNNSPAFFELKSTFILKMLLPHRVI
jgi:hypothetical protein